MRRGMAGVVLMCATVASGVAPAEAHEARHIAGFGFEVGWAVEPPLVGFQNAVTLDVHDPAEQPVRDLGTSVKLEVLFGEQKSDLMTFEPAGDPGAYRVVLVPTRPGRYRFRLVGTLRGRKIDAVFQRDIEAAVSAADAQFPAKDPSLGEIAERLDRLGPRIDALGPRIDSVAVAARSADDAADLNRILALIGLGLGGIALLVAVFRRPRRAATPQLGG